MSEDNICGYTCKCKCESDCPFLAGENDVQNKGYIKVINGYTYHFNDDIIRQIHFLYNSLDNKNKKS